MDDKKRKRGNGRRLTCEEKLKIIEKLESSDAPSGRAIAREFEVDEKTIRKIKKEKATIKLRISKMSEDSRKISKRVSIGKFPELEERLFHWLNACQLSEVSVSSSMIQDKAKAFAHELNIPEGDFVASNGWYSRFRKRWNLGEIIFHGEGGTKVEKNRESMDLNTIMTSIESLRKDIEEFVRHERNCAEDGRACVDASNVLLRNLRKYNSVLQQSKTQTSSKKISIREFT